MPNKIWSQVIDDLPVGTPDLSKIVILANPVSGVPERVTVGDLPGTGVVVTSNVVNRIVRGSGVANNLLAGADLTFNGDTFHLSNSAAKALDLTFDAYGAPIFTLTVGTPEVGHNSPALWIRNLDEEGAMFLGFRDNNNKYVGEIGATNIMSTINGVSNWQFKVTAISRDFETTGLLPIPRIGISCYGRVSGVNSGHPLMTLDENIRFYKLPFNQAAFDLDYEDSDVYVGRWDLKTGILSVGDNLHDGLVSLQVHGTGGIELKSDFPAVYWNFATMPAAHPFTFGSTMPGKYVARMMAAQGAGGVALQGFSEGDEGAIFIQTHVGHITPTVAGMFIDAYKSDGADSRSAVSGAEKMLCLRAGTSQRFLFSANGNFVTGASVFVNYDDGFIANNAAIGLHSNNHFYLQGHGSGGLIFAGDNTRSQYVKVSAANNNIEFLTGVANVRVVINTDGTIKANVVNNYADNAAAVAAGLAVGTLYRVAGVVNIVI